MARVAERGSFVRSEVVAVLGDARLEDVVGKTHGFGQRVGGLELNAVGKVLPGADEQGVVVARLRVSKLENKPRPAKRGGTTVPSVLVPCGLSSRVIHPCRPRMCASE